MIFSDQSHISRVRGALWQRSGGASIMVGAGFSKNASKAHPDADTPPTWPELTRAISHRLDPQGGSGSRQGKEAGVPEPGSFPRLAQEYEAAFGRVELNRLLQSLVRDDDLKPRRRTWKVAAASLARCLHHQLGHALGKVTHFRT